MKIDSATTGEIWQRVENTLPEAITAAESGTVLAHTRLVGILCDVIALHFVRNLQVRDLHMKTCVNTYDAGVAS